MIQKDLKPCPFCGGEAIMQPNGPQDHGYHGTQILCDNFSVNGHTRDNPCPMAPLIGYFSSPESAVDAWNTRAERTCKATYEDVDARVYRGKMRFYTCECGNVFVSDQVNYCSGCGCKIRKERYYDE